MTARSIRPTSRRRPSGRTAPVAPGGRPLPVWHSRKSDEWSTPQDRFAEWEAEFGPFTLDVAATAENALCERYFTADDDGLAKEWTGTVWCNPPYSSIARWAEKAYHESKAGATVVMLVPSRTDTRWWHDWAVRATERRFLKGRLRFGEAKWVAPFPSALLVFRPEEA
jgi:phage N-6-adenine-methyltransferase